MKEQISPSIFRSLANIEYFDFEEDFVEENMRCIPMIVRFKMDLAGIKLKLAHWCKFTVGERIELAIQPCNKKEEVSSYRKYLSGLIQKYGNEEPATIPVHSMPEWANESCIPEKLREKAIEFNWEIPISRWSSLTNLQRFALLKLLKPGHENKHFPNAMREFKLTSGICQ